MGQGRSARQNGVASRHGQRRGSNTRQDKARNPEEGKYFHSAVNRIPVLRPSVLKDVSQGLLPWEVFGEGQAVGHDHLIPDRWSGTIDLELTVRTPLVFGEQKKSNGKGGATTVSLPMDDDQLFIPPTMVKGMLSRAYEVLTASRFRVFDVHDQALTYRADPAAANGLYGGRICFHEDTGELRVEVFQGDKKSRFAYFSDVKPEDYRSETERNAEKVLTAVSVSAIPSGDEVRVRAIKTKGKFIVTSVSEDGKWVRLIGAPKESGTLHELVGYVCRTTPDGKRVSELFGTKKYERLFFHSEEDKTSPVVLNVDEETQERYYNVVRSYLHYSQEPGGEKHLLNRVSQRARKEGDVTLGDGDLVFVLPRGSASDPWEEFDILPTMVGRRPYDFSPRELAQRQGVLPLTHASAASPADRLFGYVIDSPAENAKRGNVAYRGRIAVGSIDTSAVRVVNKDKQGQPLHHLLPTLLAPKLSSARRFLTDAQGATPKKKPTPKNKEGTLKRSEYYSEGQFLGAAAYPVHRSLLNTDALPKSGSDTNGLPSSDAVHMFVDSYVAPKSRMRCQISVTNLSREELGLLLWLLTPENLVPKAHQEPKAKGYLRMGLGKPLGLGAVEVRVATNGLRLKRNEQLATDYASLAGVLGTVSEEKSSEEFLSAIPQCFEDKVWVQAFQRAAYGYSSKRVRYMTLEENKKNNLTDSKTGEPKPGRGVSPQDLWGLQQGEALQVRMTK